MKTQIRITKKDIAGVIAEQTGLTERQSMRAVHAVADFISDSLIAGNYVGIKGLGTFSVCEKKPHMGTNFHTKTPIAVPARKAVKFTPGVYIQVNLND